MITTILYRHISHSMSFRADVRSDFGNRMVDRSSVRKITTFIEQLLSFVVFYHNSLSASRKFCHLEHVGTSKLFIAYQTLASCLSWQSGTRTVSLLISVEKSSRGARIVKKKKKNTKNEESCCCCDIKVAEISLLTSQGEMET